MNGPASHGRDHAGRALGLGSAGGGGDGGMGWCCDLGHNGLLQRCCAGAAGTSATTEVQSVLEVVTLEPRQPAGLVGGLERPAHPLGSRCGLDGWALRMPCHSFLGVQLRAAQPVEARCGWIDAAATLRQPSPSFVRQHHCVHHHHPSAIHPPTTNQSPPTQPPRPPPALSLADQGQPASSLHLTPLVARPNDCVAGPRWMRFIVHGVALAAGPPRAPRVFDA
ncbi:hypothetical protein Purlil1_3524 [Purpureocillium lilacinum]|uniref:Uncharacterized protein n=1 Tax=Purpureocillium lilacinum TaxID=33203 RepID=A0ABR0C871_PURLI|nr:hypothetical protein Purlil1_3524 [Purpureocillium lilacinum]